MGLVDLRRVQILTRGMVPILLFLLTCLAHAQAPTVTFTGSTLKIDAKKTELSELVSAVASANNMGEIVYLEPLPSTKVTLKATFRGRTRSHSMNAFADKYGLIYQPVRSGNRFMVFRKSVEPPAKDVARIFFDNNSASSPKPIQVAVSEIDAGKFLYLLNGVLTRQIQYNGVNGGTIKDLYLFGDESQIIESLKKLKPGFTLKDDGGTLVATKITSAKANRTWRLAFANPAFPAPLKPGGDLSNQNNRDQAAEFAKSAAKILNDVAGKEDLARSLGESIFLKGSASDVSDAEYQLALAIDLPRPQVRLDFWTIQVNSRIDCLEDSRWTIDEIDRGREIIQALLMAFDFDLSTWLRQRVPANHRSNLNTASGDFQNTKKNIPYSLTPASVGYDDAQVLRLLGFAGFNPNINRPLPVVDKLILLNFVPQTRTYADLSSFMDTFMELRVLTAYQAVAAAEVTNHREEHKREVLMELLERVAKAAGYKMTLTGVTRVTPRPLPRLSSTYPGMNHKADITGIGNFLAQYLHITGKIKDDHYASNPRRLVRASVATDLELRAGYEGLHGDLSDIFYNPFYDWTRIRASEREELSLVGKVGLVTSGHTVASTQAQAESFYPFTPVEERKDSEGNDLLQNEDGIDLTRLGVLLRPEARFIRELFRKQPLPVFARLAPGMGISVSSTVTPKSEEARLQINLINSLETDEDSAQKELIKKGVAPVDFVKSQTLTTDVTVHGIDLLELSTFGVQTTRRGQPSWKIPVLDEIPFLGPVLFRGPKYPHRRHQESMILVRVSIIPRSMDLLNSFLEN